MAKTVKIAQKRQISEVFTIISSHLTCSGVDLTCAATETQPVQTVPKVLNIAGIDSFPVIYALPLTPHEVLTEVETELFEERSGIMEFDAGMSRTDADNAAFEDTIISRSRGTPAEDILIQDFACVEIKGALYDSLPKFADRDENGITRLPNRISKTSARKVETAEHRLFGT